MDIGLMIACDSCDFVLFVSNFYFPCYMQDTWEKRLAYIQVVVELIAVSSENKATHNMSYTEPISHLFEAALDIAMQGIMFEC